MGSRITKEEWIRRCKIHHGEKFDYSISNFSGMRGRVDIICPNHGIVSVSAETHARGGDCFRCVYMPERGHSLGDLFPQAVVEWHTNNEHSPFDYKPSAHFTAQWICKECDYEWFSRIQDRTQKRMPGEELGICPCCRGHEVHQDGRNSLQVLYPDIASEFDVDENSPLQLGQLTHGTHKRVHWRCTTCDHQWQQKVGVRTKQGTGCPACSNHSLHVDKRNSLANLYPKLIERFHPSKNEPNTPQNIVGRGDKIYWWHHALCGHEWRSAVKTQILSLENESHGCSYCSKGHLHSDGRNSLAKTNPELLSEWHPSKNRPLTPQNTVAGTGKKIWWICNDCKHEWKATGDKRSAGKRGCPVCAKGSYAIHSDGRNSFASLYPLIAEEWHPSKNKNRIPSEFRAGSDFRAYWICKSCSWEWRQSINVRIGMGTGCPKCAPVGFKQDQPAYYYSMTISGPTGVWWYKGGISDDPERRMVQIQRSLDKLKFPLEVQLYDKFSFVEGWMALELETKLLRCKEIRETTIEKFSGANELFSVDPIQYARAKGWID
jgi:Zn finger protein HypA/HybF involved in hydrogenase expression